MKEESARSSPELAPEPLAQRRQQPAPLRLSFPSENSAFDRVVSRAVGGPRQGYLQPAEPGAPGAPENFSEQSWRGPAHAHALPPPPMKVLEGERRESPELHIRESSTDEDALFAEVLERSRETILALENRRRSRAHQDHSGNQGDGPPAVTAITLEPWKDPERRSHPPPADHQPRDRTGRSEVVMYIQKEPVSPEAGVPTRKHKVRLRSLSDYTGPAQLQALRVSDPSARRQSVQAGEPPVEGSVLDTRVSVAQLRNAFLESASKKSTL